MRDLKAETRYCYKVTATDDAQRESLQSNEACATTPAPVVMEEKKKEAASISQAIYTFEDIHFDYDRYNLKNEARAILDKHVEWFKNNKDVMIVIEGHADERGTSEYNMALGERRANAAARYLIAHGD